MDFSLGHSVELEKRRAAVEHLLEVAFEEEDRPVFLADSVTLGDVLVGDEADLRSRVMRHYGYWLRPADLEMPLWQLLDQLSQATGQR